MRANPSYSEPNLSQAIEVDHALPGGSLRPTILFLSHLPWDEASERSRALMTRAAQSYEIVFWEPVQVCAKECVPVLRTRRITTRMLVATPVLPTGLGAAASDAAQRKLLDGFLYVFEQQVAIAYYHAPLTGEFAGHVKAMVTVYDCDDVPSTPHAKSSRQSRLEASLFNAADLVVYKGRTVFGPRHKKRRGSTFVYGPADHKPFQAARQGNYSPAWQNKLPRPRIGYFGPVDGRLDLPLLDRIVTLRPTWQFIMLMQGSGCDISMIPKYPNLHWRRLVAADLLPAYLSGWDAGFLPLLPDTTLHPFGAARRLEFLAAGVPVVCSSVDKPALKACADDLAPIRRQPEGIVAALQHAIAERNAAWLQRVDDTLSTVHWDTAWLVLQGLIERLLAQGGMGASPGSLLVDGNGPGRGTTLHMIAPKVFTERKKPQRVDHPVPLSEAPRSPVSNAIQS